MIYDIRQTTTYHYASAVAYARHVLRQAPIERREGHDFFGNRMTWIELNQPHDTLSVRVAARVAVKRDVTPEATPPWEEIREAAFASIDLSPNSPAHYLFPSRQGLARSGNSRLRRRQLFGGAPGSRRGRRSDASDQGR